MWYLLLPQFSGEGSINRVGRCNPAGCARVGQRPSTAGNAEVAGSGKWSTRMIFPRRGMTCKPQAVRQAGSTGQPEEAALCGTFLRRENGMYSHGRTKAGGRRGEV